MKSLISIFNKLCYGRQPTEVFDNLLTITYTQFCPKPHEEDKHKQAVSSYNKKEKVLINEWVHYLALKYKEGIDKKNWCDPLGDLYMEISGSYKTQGLGQFFTPEAIVDLMVKMQGFTFKLNSKINDPTCGSGRMLLAFHANNYGNYFYAEDIDPICCKMTVTNFVFHGCLGEVICHDSLKDHDSLNFGWKITNIGLPIPAIIPITAEESFSCKMWKNMNKAKQLNLNIPNQDGHPIYLI